MSEERITIPIGGSTYGLPYQAQFRDALEEGDYQTAREVIRKLPVPGRYEKTDILERSAFVLAAYSLLVDRMLEEQGSELSDDRILQQGLDLVLGASK
ncbi:MAG: hypothetical protein Q8Q31_05990 [Nanoarchaeota archaeon]|nr:hypothetical protein [Nanoarchaeota archaeon]